MKPNLARVLTLWLGLGLFGPTAAHPQADHVLRLSPGNDLASHITYLRSTWPNQFAIAVVEAAEAAVCNTPDPKPELSRSNEHTYCWLKVRSADPILVRWLYADPMAPGDEMTIHYWYDKHREDMKIKPGERLLVLLAPTHFQSVYSCTLLMSANPERVKKVRCAIREAIDDPLDRRAPKSERRGLTPTPPRENPAV